MKFTLKDYRILKTKHYIKTTNLFSFLNGTDQKTKNWIKVKQKNRNFNYCKSLNKTSIKIFKNSIYKNITSTVNGSVFFIKLVDSKFLLEKTVFTSLEDLAFIFLASKINNKVYNSQQLKNLYILNYYKNKLFMYQFLVTNLKNKF